jgi:hypothetical protein
LIPHLIVEVQGLQSDNFLEVYSPSISLISTIEEDGEYILPYEYHVGDTWLLGFQLNDDGPIEQECSVVLETGDSQNDEGFILGPISPEDVKRTLNCSSEGEITPTEDYVEEDGGTICRPSINVLINCSHLGA